MQNLNLGASSTGSTGHQGCGGEFAAGFPDLVLHLGAAASLLPAPLGELCAAEAV